MSKRRIELDILDWARFILEVIVGVLYSAFYIFKDIFETIFPPEGKSIKGQHVLVTGGARGLGRELCIELARHGCKITVVDIEPKGCQETTDLVNAGRPGTASWRLCDITDRDQVAQLVKDVPPIDILVNNAGIVSSASILEVTDAHIQRMIEVNLMAHFWTVRAVLPGMIQRGRGHIVAVASAAAFTCAANIAPYTATKYAVTGYMASLREEFRRAHPQIKTTTIHPFFISPPPSCVEHWNKTSRIPDVTAPEVAKLSVLGIKRNKVTVTIPPHLYYLLQLTQILPSLAGEMWRDMFYANISSLPNNNKPEQITNNLTPSSSKAKVAA